MALYTIIIPFIKQSEGGLSDDPNDPASAHFCPYSYFGKQYHTSAGFCWETFSEAFGVTPESATRFFQMSDRNAPNTADWDFLFKKTFWDKICGDQINSQRIANTIVDWYFNSMRWATLDTQKLLDQLFNDHLVEDGAFGNMTIQAINDAPEAELYQDIINKRIQFYKDIVTNNPSQAKYLTGWLSRIEHLQQFNITLHV